MTHTSPKLHNAMWPGLVGKGTDEGQEPPISLERMLDLTAAAEVNGQKFEGIDYFLFLPHTNPEATDDELQQIADLIQSKGFKVGSLGRPGLAGYRRRFGHGRCRSNAKSFCRPCAWLAASPEFSMNMACANTVVFASTRPSSASKNGARTPRPIPPRSPRRFREAASIAADSGERLAAEGEICWAGMHSWKDMLNLLEEVGMPETLGFQADLAHTYLYLMGYNAPEHALAARGLHARTNFTPPMKR